MVQPGLTSLVIRTSPDYEDVRTDVESDGSTGLDIASHKN